MSTVFGFDLETLAGEGGVVAAVLSAGVSGLAAFLVCRALVRKREPAPRAGDTRELLTERYLQGVTLDRRAFPRRAGNPVEVELSTLGDQPPFPGLIFDRSTGGLGITVEQPVAAGSLLRIRAKGKKPLRPWTEITVRDCQRDGRHFAIRCQFRRQPNWNELLEFG